MGHSADATNRLISNKALRTKGKSYESFKDYSKSRPSNKRYKFKTPSAKELKILEGKNRAFLKEQKMQNRVILIFAFAVGMAIFYWFSQTGIWEGYMEGIGKLVR